jgi:hypothetical protein
MTMMVYDMGRQYHAERIMGGYERRRADAQAGQLAASAARAWQRAQAWQRYLTRPVRALRGLRMPGATISG